MTDSDRSSPPAAFVEADGAKIAYRAIAGKGPCVVFLTGFRSDMTGSKALALESLCRDRGQAFVRFDYTGHGESSGRFEDGTIGRWTEDALAVIDRVTEGPLVLVGSSMGGWIMLLVALARPERVAGLVGIAAAPDFTETLMWEAMPPETRARLKREGVIYEESAYDPEPTPITYALIEEGRRHLLLDDAIPLRCPVRLIHGMRDPDVPWRTSIALAGALASEDVEIHLVKAGDHRLSEPRDIARLARIVGALLDRIEAGGQDADSAARTAASPASKSG